MIKPLLDGLGLTLRHFFKKPITLRYPEEKWVPPERFRGQPVLISDEKGNPLCVACGLCERICPCGCITVIPETGDDGIRQMKRYTIDLLRCCFCGLCVESCPVDAIEMSSDYELAGYEKDSFVLNDKVLLRQKRACSDSREKKKTNN